MYSGIKSRLAAAIVLVQTIPGLASQVDISPSGAQVDGIAGQIVESMADTRLRSLVLETLERNPEIAMLSAQARAAALRGPQVRSLPDPLLAATAWVDGPETRTGPQVLTLTLMQPLPWLGKLDAQEQAAVLEARALVGDVESRRLELVTTVRRLYFESAFLVRQKSVSEDYLDHLRQHEKISQSRYATGIGSSQDVVKIQAEITLAEKLVIDIDRRRIALEAKINAMRDLPSSAAMLPPRLPPGRPVDLDYQRLSIEARHRRPEVQAAEARVEASRMVTKRVGQQSRPDFGLGVTYSFVDPRQDSPGRVMPPEGNGDDILGIQGAVTLPIWRQKLRAGAAEARELESVAQETRRSVVADIEAALGDLMQRIPLTWRQLRLLEDILILQAEESVRSAQSGYVSGNLNALDLLDAEHVLFDAETAIARARADYAIQLAELEGIAAVPIEHDATWETLSP